MKKNILKIKQFDFWGKMALGFLFLVIILGLSSNFIASFIKANGPSLQPPSLNHFLGTDDLGLDLFIQILRGARISLIIGFATSLIAGLGGGLLGVIAGYKGGFTDKLIMRLTDIVLALPDLPMMILLGAFFGPSIQNIILVLVFFSWTGPARVVRAKVISIKNEPYIRVAESYGAKFPYLFKTHFLPEIIPVLAISIIKITSRAITAEAGLAFLGLGDPTARSWGLILNHAINFEGIYFTSYWQWWVMAPLLALLMLILSISYISKQLER